MTEYKLSTKTLITALDAVYRCAGGDGFYNPNLQSVLIETGAEFTAAATNGHLLARYSEQLTPALPAHQYMIRNEDVAPAIELLRHTLKKTTDQCDDCGHEWGENLKDKPCTFWPTGDQIGIFDEDLLIAALKMHDGDFPSIKKVIPKHVERTFTDGHIGVQTKYLRLIADCFDAAFPKAEGVFFEPIARLEPVVWSYRRNGRMLVIVCMPVRSDSDSQLRPVEATDE